MWAWHLKRSQVAARAWPTTSRDAWRKGEKGRGQEGWREGGREGEGAGMQREGWRERGRGEGGRDTEQFPSFYLSPFLLGFAST